MLTLIETGDLKKISSLIISGVKEALEEKKRSYLILPEQLTVTAEREMCEALPESAPLYFEATNFTRFANSIFRYLGGLEKEYGDKVKKSLLMWRTLTELSSTISLTGGRQNPSYGHVKKALGAVEEMENAGIDCERVAEVKEGIKAIDARLYEKLCDVSLIYSLFTKLYHERYGDVKADMYILAKRLEEKGDSLKGSVIYIDGFTSFTEPQYTLISTLIRLCDVRVCLPVSHKKRAAFEYKEIIETERRLSAIAMHIGAKRSIVRPEEKDIGIIKKIAELMWTPGAALTSDESDLIKSGNGGVRIYAADTPFDECDFIAADIMRRVTGGARFSDIAIVAKSPESYSGILDTALLRSGIPHFISLGKDVTSFEAIKLIRTAYLTVKGGFRKEDLLTYMKCGLAGISRSDGDLFESYVEKWGIDSSRFTDGIVWNMSPRGYEVTSCADAEKLAIINRVRESLVEPLLGLQTEISEAGTVREHATALYRFICRISLAEKLDERAEELYRLGESNSAEENERLYDTICSALDVLVDTLGDLGADAESFISMLSVIFSEEKIGRIPAREDEVTVGSSDQIRLKNKKYVYLIGASRGVFPASVSDSSFFNDREKALLLSEGLGALPATEGDISRELYCFSRALAYAECEATVTYTERTAAFAEAGPSIAISAIEDLTGGLVSVKRVKELPPSDMIYTPEAAADYYTENAYAREEIKKALIAAGHSHLLAKSLEDIENAELTLSKDVLGVIYGKELYLSQTKIDSFLRCPMSYFLKYNLKLDVGEPARLDARVIGTFVHSILESFFSEVARRGISPSELTAGEKAELTERSARSYIESVMPSGRDSARTAMAIKRLCRSASPVIDSLCDEFSSSRFTPVLFEAVISDRDEKAPSTVKITSPDGNRIIIGGVIDRVDAYSTDDKFFVRVVDYKTGGKDFSPKELSEGRNLQMLLYLKSVVGTKKQGFLDTLGASDGQKLLPAGVVYVKASVKDVKVRSYDDSLAFDAVKAAQGRDGMLLDDPDALMAENPDFLPFDPKKPGDKLYSEEDWEKINETIESAVIDVAKRIRSGVYRAEPNKKDRPCESCKYKPVCRSAR